MNNRVRILGVTILTTIYCLAVINVSYSPQGFGFGNHPATEQDQYLATIAKSLFCHTSPSESSGSSCDNSSISNFKNLFDKLWSITESSKQLFEAAFTQYCNFSINFLVKYRKTDLIFPFHYYW